MTENILQVKRNDEFYYPIVFRKNFEDLSNQLKTLELQERKCCIVTDSNVAPIYLETVKKELEKVSDTIISIILPAGEENKTFNQSTFRQKRFTFCIGRRSCWRYDRFCGSNLSSRN